MPRLSCLVFVFVCVLLAGSVKHVKQQGDRGFKRRQTQTPSIPVSIASLQRDEELHGCMGESGVNQAEVGCQTAAGSSEELLPAEIEAQREEAALLTALAQAGPSAPAAPTLTSASVASQTNVSGLLALQLNNLQALEASSPHLWEAPIDQTVQCDLDVRVVALKPGKRQS